jgi:hypothetical protein
LGLRTTQLSKCFGRSSAHWDIGVSIEQLDERHGCTGSPKLTKRSDDIWTTANGAKLRQ